PLDLSRCAARNQQFGKGSISTPDVDPSQARARRQPIDKDVPDKPAPNAHHALVGRPVIKSDLRLSHHCSLPGMHAHYQPASGLSGSGRMPICDQFGSVSITGTPPRPLIQSVALTARALRFQLHRRLPQWSTPCACKTEEKIADTGTNLLPG